MFSKASFWIFLALAVIIGLSIGLFLGWVVWPVEWVDASPDLMRIEFQEDWMNMAIDSYTVNQNAPLAAQRYDSLGTAAPDILAGIQGAPVWVSPAEVDAFSAAVTGEQSAAAPGAEATAAPTGTTQSTKVGWYVALLILLALAAIVLLIMLVMRLLRHHPAEQPALESAATAAVAGEEPVASAVVAGEEPVASAVVAGEEPVATAPVEAVAEGAQESQAELEEAGGGERLGEMAAAAVVAGVVTSEAGEGETTAEEAIVAEEVAAEEEVTTEVPTEELSAQVESPAIMSPEAAVAAEQVVETEVETTEADDRSGVGLAGLAATAATAAVIVSQADKSEEAVEAETAVAAVPVVEAETPAAEAADHGSGGVAPVALGASGLAAGLEWALEDEAETTPEAVVQDEFAAAPAVVQEIAEEVPLGDAVEEAPADTAAAAEPAAVDWLPETEVAESKLVEAEEPPKDFWGKYNRKIIDVEGIGPAYSEKLAAQGITTTQGYLQQCATPRGRQDLAAKTGISSKYILEWANHIDLMRIQGIGPQWSELLEAADVNTVREMALRNPKNLLKTMSEVNETKKLVRQLPTLAQLEDWIEQAKELPRILDY